MKNIFKTSVFLHLFSMLIFAANAQTRTISGVVCDEDGLPLAGTIVYVVNTQIATMANNDGKYTLIIPKSRCKVCFSFIGTMEIIFDSDSIPPIVKLVSEPEELEVEEVRFTIRNYSNNNINSFLKPKIFFYPTVTYRKEGPYFELIPTKKEPELKPIKISPKPKKSHASRFFKH